MLSEGWNWALFLECNLSARELGDGYYQLSPSIHQYAEGGIDSPSHDWWVSHQSGVLEELCEA